MIPDRPTCRRCGGREMWLAPSVADETWWDRFDVAVAWRRDGAPVGSFEVCACAACGLVQWYAEGLGALASDGVIGASQGREACVVCDGTVSWHVGPMRDVRSALNDSDQLSVHVRGLTYRVRAPAPLGDDEPILVSPALARPLTRKTRTRNLVLTGALNGRPVGRLYMQICATCGHTLFDARGLEQARSAGRAIEHACARCRGSEAIELTPLDIRSEGVAAKRMGLARGRWGGTRAELTLRACPSCEHAEWYIDDTKELAADAWTGLAPIETGQRSDLGAYRGLAKEVLAEDGRAPRARSGWLAIVAVSALTLAIVLAALVHPAWLLVGLLGLAASTELVRRARRPAPAERRAREGPRVRVAIEEPADEATERDEVESERSTERRRQR